MLPKICRQRREKFGMRRRICGAEIVDRIDDAARKELSPDPIHGRFGKVRMRRHPSREFLTRIAVRSDRQRLNYRASAGFTSAFVRGCSSSMLPPTSLELRSMFVGWSITTGPILNKREKNAAMPQN